MQKSCADEEKGFSYLQLAVRARREEASLVCKHIPVFENQGAQKFGNSAVAVC